MSEKLKVELQDSEGNVYYLHTDSSVVFREDGTPIEDSITALEENIKSLNSKTVWTQLYSGSDKIGSGIKWTNTPFSSYDVVLMNIEVQAKSHTITLITGRIDRAYTETFGYYIADINRVFTLLFATNGRYLSDVNVRMTYGNSSEWTDQTDSVIITKIYGANLFGAVK